MAGGLTLLAAYCSCQANFSVTIDDSSGQVVDVPINTLGTYSGVVAEGLAAGDYTMQVDADSTWTVAISQPGAAAGADLPQTYSESGQQVVGPFTANGSIQILAENSSALGGNFVVTVLNSDGAVQDVPITEDDGDYGGSAVSNNLNGGPYWLEVTSDGAWSIAVSAL